MTFPENLKKISNFSFIDYSSRLGHKSHEPYEGLILYKNYGYEFKFSHEFDEGSTYIVYDENRNPVYYFAIRYDFESEGVHG